VSAEKVITSDGGVITLKDGTKLTVPAGAFTKETNLVLSSDAFGADSTGILIDGLGNLDGEITLTYPIGKGLDPNTLSVFGLDPQTASAYEFPYEYDANEGLVSVKIYSASPQSTQNSWLRIPAVFAYAATVPEKVQVIVQFTNPFKPSNKEILIPMPYYEQMGQGCWAAATYMLIHGYASPEWISGIEPMTDVMHYIGVRDDDFGIDPLRFMLELPGYIKSKADLPAKWKAFMNNEHLRWELMRQLNTGHPVILRYWAIESFHAVLVIGYQDNGETFIIHDPKNMMPENENSLDRTMYSTVSWKWLDNRLNQTYLKTQVNPIIWIDQPIFKSPNLQTIMASGAEESGGSSEGQIGFFKTNPISNRLALAYHMQIKPSSRVGYTWETGEGKEEVISSDVDLWGLTLPMWNTDSSSVNVTAMVKVFTHGESGSKEMYTEMKDVSLNAASMNKPNDKQVNFKIPMAEIRDVSLADSKGIENVTAQVTLWDSKQQKRLLDQFTLDAPIYVTPHIQSISPESGLIGKVDTITIKGQSFNKQQTPKSKVMIGDKRATIISWSDSEIKVKPPDDVSTGSVIVYTGDKYEFKSNTNIKYTALGEGSPEDFKTFWLKETKLWNENCKCWGKSELQIAFYAHDGKIYAPYDEWLEISGTYSDDKINLTFTYYPEYYHKNASYTEVITGTVIGDVIKDKFGKPWGLQGTTKCSNRAYSKDGSYDVSTGPYDCMLYFEVY
jgi:hypothetical protein